MDRTARLEELLQKWEEAFDNGTPLSAEELCRDYPELLGELQGRIDALRSVKQQLAKSKVPPESAELFDAAPDSLSQAKLSTIDPVANRALTAAQSVTDGIPAIIGRYFVEEKIGKGGMGAVLRVRDSVFERDLAVKVMLPDVEIDGDARRRFLEEAKLTGQLQHPGIPPVHELGEMENGLPFFAMKLIKGVAFSDVLKRRKSGIGNKESGHSDPDAALPTPERLISIFGQICQTIGYAHSRGVIHRDLKPHNIMVGAFGEVQVMDWGLAKWIADLANEEDLTEAGSGTVRGLQTRGELALSQTGEVMGTPAYMAPEQARGEIRTLDARCDVFGLGAILCQILTGKPAFRGRDTKEMILQAMDGDLLDAFGRLDKCTADKELVAICKRCLQPDRDKRPADAGELAAAIEQYETQVQERLRQAEIDQAEAKVQAAEERKRRRIERQKRRWTMAAALAGVLVIVGAGAAALLMERQHAERIAERKVRHAQIEANIKSTVEKVRESIDRLDADLAAPRGVFRLLDAQADWNRRLVTAETLLAQAEKQQAEAQLLVDSALGERLAKLRQRWQQHKADRILAVRLDKIRLDRSVTVKGKPDNSGAMTAYKAAFATRFPVLTGDSGNVAAAIQGSPLKELLTAGLDDWAYVSWILRKHDTHATILRVVRLAEPDPLRDQFRDAKLWRNRDQLAALAKDLLQDSDRFAALSPQTLQLVGSLLPTGKQEKIAWLRRAQAHEPRDFWLACNLGIALHNSKNNLEAAGMFRITLAIRPKSAAAWYNLGVALADQQKLDEAVAAYKKALANDADHAYAWNNLGIALADQQKLDEAVAAYKKALAIDAKNAMAWNNLGSALANQQKLDEAIAAIEKALANDANFAGAWNNLGTALQKQNKLDEAVAAYKKALAIDANFAMAWYDLAIALRRQNKLDEAVAAYKKALAIDPKDAMAWYNLGDVLYRQQKLDEAVTALKKALAIDANFAKAWNDLGIALSDHQKLDEAVTALKKALAIDANFAMAWYNLGNILYRQQKLDEAVAAYKKALAIDAKDAYTWINLGIALRRQNKLDEAVAAYKKALTIDADHAYAWNNLGRALANQQKLDEAIAAYKKALAIDAKDAMAWNNLGIALRHQNRLDEAVAAYKKALAIDANFAKAWNNFGVALRQQNKLDEAVAAYKKALAIDANFAKAWNDLGDVLYRQQKLDEAVAAYKKALAIDAKDAYTWINLGVALRRQNKLDEAVAAYKKALAIDANYPYAHNGLGLALRDQGRFVEAVAALERGAKLVPPRHWLRAIIQWNLSNCRELLALEKKLAAALHNPQTASGAERLQMAALCQRYLKRHRDAVTLFRTAFTANPKAANDLDKQYRYNAACAAALAAGGKGKDADKINADTKSKLRGQALTWLLQDLSAYRKLLDAKPQTAVMVQERMAHWQKDADLAAVRETKPRAAMAEPEREEWARLWANVAAIEKHARAGYTEKKLTGQLTETDTTRKHNLQLSAGKVYVIDMKSKQFDTLLRLEDTAGKNLAENDDINYQQKILDSRITFTPNKSGMYRLIAGSYQNKGRGRYELFLREFAAKK